MQDCNWPDVPSKTIRKEIPYQEKLDFYIARILEGQEELEAVDLYLKNEDGQPLYDTGWDGYGGGPNRYHINSVKVFLQAIQEHKVVLVLPYFSPAGLVFKNKNYYSECAEYHLRISEIFAKLAQKQTKGQTWEN